MRFFTGLRALLLVWPVAVVEQCCAANSGIEELVITPNLVPVPLRQIGTSLSVVDADEIQRHGDFSLADILRQLPAVSLSNAGGVGQPTSLRIRGEESFRTLVLIDGIRLSDPSGTQIGSELEHIASSGIGRVEVLRGPQGLGYGADAGGVINISTLPTGAQLQAGVEAEGGSYDSRQGAVHVSGGSALGDFFVSAADYTTGGFNSRTDDAVLQDRDGYDNTTWHARVGLNLADGWRLELVHHRVNATSAFDDCGFGTAINDCVATFDQRASRLALTWHNPLFSHSLSYATTATDRDSLANGVSGFATQGSLQRWEYLGSTAAWRGMTLVFGADHERDAIASLGRSSSGYFAELIGHVSDAWFFSLGERHDHNDVSGSNNSYRLTTAWLVNTGAASSLKVKASAGSGFRAPSPYEIAYNRGPYAYPPASLAALQQERSRGYEAGLEFDRFQGLHLEAVYFRQQVENAINFDLFSYSGYLQDQGRSTSHGIELSGKWPLTAQLNLQANYTWNPSERPDGSPRLRRPRQLANAGIAWQDPRQPLELHAFARLSRDAVDQTATGIVPLDDFVVLDAGASYHWTPRLQLFARLENALNAHYQEVAGYNTARTAVYAGFRYQFAQP